ncbi:MAG TPA: condensation domain-containing protein, partial [Longimicrobium sp.]|nr:condensation domain-containing protein [Longimicrobium sp.]
MNGTFPLSLAQARFHRLEHAVPEGGFNQACVYTLEGPLDTAILRRVLEEVARRQGALRTVLASADGGILQRVLPAVEVPLHETDLRDLPADARPAEARREALRIARARFDLEVGPIVRFHLLRLGDTEHQLLVVLHHVASDGWSTYVIFREVAALYAAFAAGLPSPLPPLDLQYGAFAARQRERLASEPARARLAAAREHIAAVPPLAIPTDRPRPAHPTYRAAVHSFELDRPLLSSLWTLSRAGGTSLHSTVLAGFVALMARWSGQDRLVVGGAVGNRDEGTEGLVGYFLNILALRAELADDPPFREIVPRMRDATQEAFALRDLPVDAVLDGGPVGLGNFGSPCFVLHDAPWPMLHAAGVTMRMSLLEVGVSPWEMVFSLRRHPGGVNGRISYHAELWDEETMHGLSQRYERILRAAAADPGLRVSELPFEPFPRRAPADSAPSATTSDIQSDTQSVATPSASSQPEASPAARTEADGTETTRATESRIVPHSFGQERFWFLERMQPGSVAYSIARAYSITGPLRPDALRQALEEIVRRHESLRTVFTSRDGEPVQVVLESIPLPFAEANLEATEPSARDEEARRRARDEAARPFDLERGPLFRATLLRLGPYAHVLTIVMHHIVSDGWSMGVLFRELAALYAAFSRGEASPLPEPRLQYADHAAWQRAWLEGERMDAQLAYWRRHLHGAPAVLDLPTDRPRPPLPSTRGAAHYFDLLAGTVDALRRLAREEGGSLFMALLAGFQALLARWSGSDDIVVGTPLANRTRPESEPLIGLLTNTLPVRAQLSGEPTFREVLRGARDATFGAHAHQDVPFGRLVDELSVERTLAHHPIYQVLFLLQNAAADALRLEGVETERVEFGTQTARVDLTLALTEQAGAGVHGMLEYATDLFDPDTAARLCRHFARLLEGAAADPDAPADALPLMDGAERRTVLETWNDTVTGYPREATVHGLFGEVAASSPGAVALVGDGDPVTYGELDARSARLARWLRARGLDDGTPVGMTLDRSADAITAILGVLRA